MAVIGDVQVTTKYVSISDDTFLKCKQPDQEVDWQIDLRFSVPLDTK